MAIYVKNIWKKSKILGEDNLIFVIVGTMYGFPRLIKEMDEIAKDIDEDVIMQIGETIYEPKNAKYFRFTSNGELAKLYNDARIVVCHSGVGTILTALEYGKIVVVVPRLKIYGEHIDDHQLEITKELEKEAMINAVYDINNLRNMLDKPINFPSKTKKENMLSIKLKEYLFLLEIK